MSAEDSHATKEVPKRQTNWESEYILSSRFEKYAVKSWSKLLVLDAYEILKNSMVVHIVYMEAYAECSERINGKYHHMTRSEQYF